MSNILIDFQQLEETIWQYDCSIEAFETLLSQLESNVMTLKSSGWSSEAGKVYFEQFDDSWVKNMRDHILIMKHLRDMMSKIKDEFWALKEQIPSIGNHLDVL